MEPRNDPRSDPGPGLAFDQVLAAAVDDALIGDILADLPEAQPGRALTSVTDFSSLYVRHRHGLAAHARRFLRDSRDVDEVVQETFLRLFLAISEIETELQAIAFARRTLTNLCIDRYRADRRRPTLITLEASPFADLASSEDEPDPVLQAEDAAIVREALARLSPLHRAALVKREIEEKALPQIAAELGIAEENVKHLLFRARRALRRLLAGTSVEPGIDLSAAEGLPKPPHTLIRGASVFIILLVGALVVATGIRPLLSGGGPSQPSAGGVGALPSVGDPAFPTGRAPAAPRSAQPTATKHHHHLSATSVPSSTGSSGSAPNAGVDLPTPQPGGNGHRPSGHPAGGVHAPLDPAPRHHFRLRGPLTVTGAPQVDQGGTAGSSNGTTVAVSSFTAPTDQGRFALNQSVTTSSSGSASVVLTPSFVVGSSVEKPELTGTTSALGTTATGVVVIDVVAKTQPDADAVVPLTSVTAHITMSPNLAEVLAETVTLTTAPQATPAPVSSTDGSPTGSTPPPASPAPTGPTPPPASPAPTGPTPPPASPAPTGQGAPGTAASPQPPSSGTTATGTAGAAVAPAEQPMDATSRGTW